MCIVFLELNVLCMLVALEASTVVVGNMIDSMCLGIAVATVLQTAAV